MTDRRFEEIRGALQRAEAAAWEAGAAAEDVHAHVRHALKLVEAVLFPTDGCAGPDCPNPVPDKGIGRPALYCSARCKDRAAYLARKQRAQRGAGES